MKDARFYLKIPKYKESEALECGFVFDKKLGCWGYDGKVIPDGFSKCPILDKKLINSGKIKSITSNKIYLKVPYFEREVAKVNGAKFDKNVKSWYVEKKVPDALTVYDIWYPHLANNVNKNASKFALEFNRAYKMIL